MIHRAACFAMGTRFELVLDDDDPSRLGPIADHVLEEITHWHNRLSLFRRDSFLSYINANALNAAIPLEPELFELFSICLAVHRHSDGAFDPAIAPLMTALGLHDGAILPAGDQSCDHATHGDPAWGQSLGPRGMAAVELDSDRRTIRFHSPGVVLDLGAIAKGFAIDMAASHLREFGIERALVHGGTSSIVAIGAPPEADGWRIAMGSDADAPVITLCDGALSFSSPSGRSVETPDGSRRTTHIIDPRVGAPAGEGVFAAAVASALTGNAVDAWPAARCEAWSTALVVLGSRPESMPETLTSAMARGSNPPRQWSIVGPHRPYITHTIPPGPSVSQGSRC